MGLQEVVMKRAERVVTREVPGVGPVKFKRLTWSEMAAIADLDSEKLVAATVLNDAGDGLFFSDAQAVKDCDGGLALRLVNLVHEINGVADPTQAEK